VSTSVTRDLGGAVAGGAEQARRRSHRPHANGLRQLADEMHGIHANDYPAQSAKCATALAQAADRAAKNAAALPTQIDPPIDSVAHSLSFVVAYGAGISPSWSLIKWKGPAGGANTPFLSASGTRTHSLNIALAPRSGGPAIGADALRLINNQVIRSLGN